MRWRKQETRLNKTNQHNKGSNETWKELTRNYKKTEEMRIDEVRQGKKSREEKIEKRCNETTLC